MAANGGRTVTRGARRADPWLINPQTHLDELARQVGGKYDAWGQREVLPAFDTLRRFSPS